MSLLLVLKEDELVAYSLVQRPFQRQEGQRNDPRLIVTLSLLSDALKLRELIDSTESGRFWFENDTFFDPDDRVDSVLLSNLLEAFRDIRGDLGGEAAQALLMQTMFIAYLEDRKIIKEAVFRDASDKTCSSLAEMLEADAPTHFETLLNFENLTVSSFDDVITGTTGNNVLDGGAGTDTVSFASYSTAVTVSLAVTTAQATGGGGTDTILNFENIKGGSANDTLTGSSGDNVLDGGNGSDTLAGGLGNDTYIVNVSTDVVTEAAGAGTDTIVSSLTYTLNETTQINVENLTLGGTLGLNATGHSGANVITGNAGSNVLNGMLGNDTLTGGAGSDYFVFNTTLGSSNVDTITDFSVADDTMRLENTGTGLFNALTTTGTLASAAYWTGSAAHDADDRIIYDSATGDVWYDADGTGATAAVKFAVLSTGLAITNTDFAVI